MFRQSRPPSPSKYNPRREEKITTSPCSANADLRERSSRSRAYCDRRADYSGIILIDNFYMNIAIGSATGLGLYQTGSEHQECCDRNYKMSRSIDQMMNPPNMTNLPMRYI